MRVGSHKPPLRHARIDAGRRWRIIFKPCDYRAASLRCMPQCNAFSRHGNTLTAFGTAGIDDCAATDRFHAGPKTVGAFAANDGRLESTFHDRSPVNTSCCGACFSFTLEGWACRFLALVLSVIHIAGVPEKCKDCALRYKLGDSCTVL
jgi:hypothetical protein